jgi:hypothetical protein
MSLEQRILSLIMEENSVNIQICISDYQLRMERECAVLVNLKTGAERFIAFADSDD